MNTIQVNGINTSYEVVGSGPALLLLHGWDNTWEAWLPLVPLLSDHFTLVMPDLPGCGKSQDPSSGWSTQEYSVWLSTFVQTASECQNLVAAVGHSYGGKMLLWNMSQAGGIPVRALVLIDASGIPVPFSLSQRIFSTAVSLIPSKVRHSIAPAVRAKFYHLLGIESDYVAASHFGRATLQKILREDLTERLSKIQVKTLLVWGKHDTATPMWQGDSMHMLIPLNKLIAFDSEHFPHHTFATQVANEIIQFLA